MAEWDQGTPEVPSGIYLVKPAKGKNSWIAYFMKK
jgi:hypothetical protein